MYSRRIDDGAVAHNERFELYLPELEQFLTKSLRRRIRNRGVDADFMHDLAAFDAAGHTWNFAPKIRNDDDHWASLRAEFVNQSIYHLYCEGPQADAVVAHVNSILYPIRIESERERERRRRALLRKEAAAKRRLSRRQKSRRQQHRTENVGNDNDVFIPAPISKKRKERLVPQFRKNFISWHEAVCAVVAIFEIDRSPLFAARELVEFRLRRSLERNHVKFAQFKREGFTLRFDTLDGMWRGDRTEVMILCTKDKKHRLYRRTREYFADMLLGLPLERQRDRRARLLTSAIALAA